MAFRTNQPSPQEKRIDELIKPLEKADMDLRRVRVASPQLTTEETTVEFNKRIRAYRKEIINFVTNMQRGGFQDYTVSAIKRMEIRAEHELEQERLTAPEVNCTHTGCYFYSKHGENNCKNLIYNDPKTCGFRLIVDFTKGEKFENIKMLQSVKKLESKDPQPGEVWVNKETHKKIKIIKSLVLDEFIDYEDLYRGRKGNLRRDLLYKRYKKEEV